jgi:hypothetical protein
MYPISQLYDQYLKERARQWAVKLDIAGTEYGMDSIIDFSVENNLTPSDDFEIGTAIPSKLVLRLKTANVIPPNARVMPYVALILPPELDGANAAWQDADIAWQDADFPWQGAITEYMPLGEFFVDKREKIGQDTWELVCYDKLVYADVAYVSQLSYPATMQAVWDEICAQLGFTYDSSVVIGSYTVPVAPTGYTCRQVMGHIAGANGASVYVGKDGLIKFRRYSASDVPVMEVTDAEYIAVTETGPAKTYTRVVVVYDVDEGLAYEAGSGDENHTLYVECPFATQTIADALLVQLSGFSFTPIQMDMRGYPQIEVGDRIRYGRAAPALTWGEADMAWQDADFSWDGYYDGGQSLCLNMTYSFKGGLSLSIDAPAKSEQESEFGVDGTLTTAINRLNRNAVKLGKTYYGVTVTADDGLTVERSDHASKVVFNSDELTWYVGGHPALQYDAVDDKLKFTGDIEMLGGSISWSNVNAPDIGDIPDLSGYLTYIGPTGIYTGTIQANQINAASLSAISANLGTVTAGSITGVTITGGTIAGAAITGGTITGATIQTSASYPKVVMSGSDLRAYKDAANYLVINPDYSSYGPAMLWYGISGLQFLLQYIGTGTFAQSSGTLYLNGSNGVWLYSSGGGYVEVDSWSSLRSVASGQTLQQVLNTINSTLSSLSNTVNALQIAVANKADKGALTAPAGPYNGGIPIGTNLMTASGGVVTWNGIPAHSHTQN